MASPNGIHLKTAACRIAGFATAAVLALTGCVRAPLLPGAQPGLQVPYGEPRREASIVVPHEKAATQIYRIGPADTLKIEVPDDPTIGGTQQIYAVTAEGYILLPYVGRVSVQDKTVTEIEQTLDSVLAKYIKNPNVKVGVQDYRSKFITVVGQVAKPGQIPMRADMLTLSEAIFAAGLITNEAAPKRTRVISPDLEKPVVRQVDLTDVLYKGKMRENILLKPNDIVYVPAKYNMNFGAALREFIQPVDDYYTTQYKLDFNKRNSDQEQVYNSLFQR